jgi:hypothetical protein
MAQEEQRPNGRHDVDERHGVIERHAQEGIVGRTNISCVLETMTIALLSKHAV